MSPPSSTIPIPIGTGAPLAASAYSPAAFSYGPTLSSSAGKAKRPSTVAKARRLSTSSQLRAGASLLSQSVPVGPANAAGRARSTSLSTVPLPDDEFDEAGPDGQSLLPASSGSKRKDKGQTYECEKCAKVYRHSTCLTKHRWEHTAHWKEASKLMLSKHQQVQLLEGAAILAAASAGSSLPDEKSFWPAAVSPPSSGLLGDAEFGINIHALTKSFGSPRFAPSSLLSDAGDFDTSRSEIDDDENDDDDQSPPPRAGSGGLEDVDEDEQMMEDGMFDLDLGGSGELPPSQPQQPPVSSLAPPDPTVRLPSSSSIHTSDSSSSRPSSRPGIRSNDSGFGSLSRSGTLKAAPSPAQTAAAALPASTSNSLGITLHPAVVEQKNAAPQPVKGFFVPQR
ncbi:zinc finger, C2H2-type domain containing protein [Rhodotorula toruloides]|uniref:Zinc finger, C2H2-type domain containing protein n=1 Tax=Rhodotorula toruloides TaxID=5286 RepID=A0A511K719_RHOTO|nr:zinc finger, C2H2-type domain containing protein [Rhodotorula toruloides]